MPAPGTVVAGSPSTTSGRNPATRRPLAAASPAMPAPTTRMRNVIAAPPPRGEGHASEPRHYRPPPNVGTRDQAPVRFVVDRGSCDEGTQRHPRQRLDVARQMGLIGIA